MPHLQLQLKLIPPLLICLTFLLTIIAPAYNCYPTINQQQQQYNYVQSIDKQLNFQPPQLEETIEEVQKILAKDPTLPRLTRGEIEELYEKVTREEYQKSIEAGDMGRADSMRALMLVLPYNTDNNTEENLQELYTRPPVTKVIDSYSSPQPIQFITPDPRSPATKVESASFGNLAATTYKPLYPLKSLHNAPSPTTYHPPPPAPVMYQMTPSVPVSQLIQFPPITNPTSLIYEYGTNFERTQTQKAPPVHRFSSHYNAKNPDFIKLSQQKRAKPTTITVKPVADVLESLGIVGQTQSRNRHVPIDDYYIAESAPQPVVTSYVPQSVTASELKSWRSQSLAPKIKSDAYTSFKPLNIGEEIRVKPEVEGYLTRFGIVGGRKRKALKKDGSIQQDNDEPASEETEIATAKVPNTKIDKGNTVELAKLLENLQELERLNVNPKTLTSATTTKRPTTTTTTTKRTTTTTTTTSLPALITNGVPLLIEPKKPRRRIDPNIDINYGAAGNQQTEQSSGDQLSKLLANLQELEKLRINPENALKSATPPIASKKPITAASRPINPVTAASTSAIRSQTITNRFASIPTLRQQETATNQQTDLEQLKRVLKELQSLEQANNARTTTTTSTRKPAPVRGNALPNDLFQLQKLLSDDSELERLYEQARAKYGPSTTMAAATTTKIPTTTTTTSTTSRPPVRPNLNELEQLQKYFAELDRLQTSTRATTTSTSTSSTTTTSTTTTTTTTPRPTISTSDFAQRIAASAEQKSKKQTIENAQLQELINRVQELERVNNHKAELAKKSSPSITTETTSPFLGFTSRNVNAAKATATDYKVPSNDFAQLQQLYNQMQRAEEATFGKIEISTAATASKANANQRMQNFAQRIIDITNDTGSGSSLQQVDPNDFVQLQKLLSKVQELERVKINSNGFLQTVTPNPKAKSQRIEATVAPNLVTAASIKTNSVNQLNGAQIIYMNEKKQASDSLTLADNLDNLKLDLPTYSAAGPTTHISKKGGVTLTEPTSSEELRDLVFAIPANPMNSAASSDKEFEQYQQFFSKIEDEERNSYKNMQPPMIFKTVTNEPPRFVTTRTPMDVAKDKSVNNKPQKADLEELQKLLNNAQELEKLGITLPTQLSQQIESKLIQTGMQRIEPQTSTTTTPTTGVQFEKSSLEEKLLTTTVAPTKIESTSEEKEYEEPSQRTVVFSLTTTKPLIPREPKPIPTESTLELPVFSATKIIEDAILRAASKIGVSTEHPKGFRRRSDTDVYELEEDNDDLIADFSEMNYQIAIPEINAAVATEENPQDITNDLTELQRLIGNLQELQKLNISVNSDVLRQADVKYLQSFKQTTADVTKKDRRQSLTPSVDETKATETTTPLATENATIAAPANNTAAVTTGASSTTTPTRISLDLNLDDDATADDTVAAASSKDSSTTESSSSTTEESRNGSLADLEDSFGPDPNTETPLPAKKKNGFYFLADWNSFLEVGGDNDQVVVRFSPKIGDPRLFLPVKIP